VQASNLRLHIFSGKKKEALHCAVCGKELGRYKYKPKEEWNMEGLLCADCHIEKTKEFMLRPDEEDKCAVCGKEITEQQDRNKPRWQWEMESDTLVCKACYQKKDTSYNKKMNFCTICNGKLGMFFYHPKPDWHMEGNLCRKCWDRQNDARR
jgi:hypothetical protein